MFFLWPEYLWLVLALLLLLLLLVYAWLLRRRAGVAAVGSVLVGGAFACALPRLAKGG